MAEDLKKPEVPAKGPTQEVVVQGRPFVPLDHTPPLPTKLFRLKGGAKHVGVEAGQTVELNARQAEAFADKFEPADAEEAEVLPPVNLAVAPSVSTPEDLGAKTPAGKTANASMFTDDPKPGVSSAATAAPSAVPSGLVAKQTSVPAASVLKTTKVADKT